MDGEERRVNGNSAAGMLQEIFPVEMAMVETRCATCGRIEPAGAEVVYADAPGLVIRCVHCESVIFTITRSDERYWINMPGTVCLQIAVS